MFLYSKIRVDFIENQRAVQKTNNQFRLAQKSKKAKAFLKHIQRWPFSKFKIYADTHPNT